MKIDRSKISNSVLIVLALLCVGVCLERMSPKTFSDILTQTDGNINACVVYQMDKETVFLKDDDFQEFWKILSECKFNYEGKHENIYYGRLWHIDFLNVENESWMQKIIISDESCIYINEKQYIISSDTERLYNYLNELYG